MMLDLERFFEEKQIPYQLWEIEHNGQVHIIDSETVISSIRATQGAERYKICGTLFALDFKNQPIIDYLRFLAKCMIEQQFKEE